MSLRSAEPGALRQPLTTLAGVGPVRAERLAKLGLECLYDLLVVVPVGLRRQGERVSVAEALQRAGQELSVRGRLGPARLLRSGPKRSTTSVELEDESGRLRVVFFNQSWMKQRLDELREGGEEQELYGTMLDGRGGVVLHAERIASQAKPLPAPGTVTPIYRLTEGLGQDYLRGLIAAAIEAALEELEEPLSAAELAGVGLPDLRRAVQSLNRPSDPAAFEDARRRLALEKLLALQASLCLARAEQVHSPARAVHWTAGERAQLLAELPHVPTPGQRRVIAEALDDLALEQPMARLLQGDVGAGKTLVAQGVLAAALQAGGQACLLAPTELLAAQHQRALGPWFEARGLACELLTGSLPGARRRSSQGRIARGETRLVIGTHALFSEGVDFQRLDLVVIDEQQRFGVAQKVALLDKGQGVHVLLMTATPIPRTLALSVYGELKVSLLTDKPPGRGRLTTHLVSSERRQKMIAFLGQRMAQGERVFWVRPRIDDEQPDEPLHEPSQAAEAAPQPGGEPPPPPPSLEALWHELKAGPLARHGMEAVHGRMEPEERARRLERFRLGAARLLLGTTIVEVGVDVPEATVMVIEGAERFGLAQLHQLRGRVGRGGRDSWCFLLGKASAQERLEILEGTGDGFEIAEEDLRQRGMGELGGLRQAGGNAEGLEDPASDLTLLLAARALVEQRAELAQRYAGRYRGRLV